MNLAGATVRLRDERGRFISVANGNEAVGVQITTETTMAKVQQLAAKANFENLRHAAGSISRDAKQSITTSPEPSEPGEPPHTRRRVFLRRAIRFHVTHGSTAVIGPIATMVGVSGMAHEFGGRFRKQEYPERPFMLPALVRAIPRFAGRWAGTIGQ